MKVFLLLLNVNNTVIGTFACQKGGRKKVKNLPRLPKRRSYQNGSKRRSKRVKNLTIYFKFVAHRIPTWVKRRRSKWVKNPTKKEVTLTKRSKRSHRSRTWQGTWVKKEVNMGKKSYQKGGLTKNGSKKRSKRVKDLRELLMLRGNP